MKNRLSPGGSAPPGSRKPRARGVSLLLTVLLGVSLVTQACTSAPPSSRGSGPPVSLLSPEEPSSRHPAQRPASESGEAVQSPDSARPDSASASGRAESQVRPGKKKESAGEETAQYPTQAPTPYFPQPELPAPLPEKKGPPSPLSGRPGGAGHQVVAVKIDNTQSAQPHTGLHFADVVYVQEVEGGLTRLLALYSTYMPRKVGPVRSARISDISLLGTWPNIAFIYSGAQSRLTPRLEKADLINLSEADFPELWRKEYWRPVRWNNHIALLRELVRAGGRGAQAQDLGWSFNEETPEGGRRGESVRCVWDDSQVGFSYSRKARGYVVSLNGGRSTSTEGGPQVASNVVIQFVRQEDSSFGDRYGGKTPMIHTVGSGDGLLLRDGREWEITWERESAAAPTKYFLPGGEVVEFRPGQTWVVLFDKELRRKVSR